LPGDVSAITRTCGENGTWSGDPPTCSPVDCGAPQRPRTVAGAYNGNVQTSGGTTFGARATYSCNTGLVLSSTPDRVCQPDGTWSGSVPKCTGCGDGEKSPQESCDLSVPGTDAW